MLANFIRSHDVQLPRTATTDHILIARLVTERFRRLIVLREGGSFGNRSHIMLSYDRTSYEAAHVFDAVFTAHAFRAQQHFAAHNVYASAPACFRKVRAPPT